MRLKISTAAALALASAAALAACNPQDGSAPAANNAPAANSARQSATPAAADNPAGPAAPAAPVNDGVRRVTIADARAMAERGEAVIYDVRDEDSFATNHVKGAKLVPLMEVEKRAAEFPKDKLIITYCA